MVFQKGQLVEGRRFDWWYGWHSFTLDSICPERIWSPARLSVLKDYPRSYSRSRCNDRDSDRSHLHWLGWYGMPWTCLAAFCRWCRLRDPRIVDLGMHRCFRHGSWEGARLGSCCWQIDFYSLGQTSKISTALPNLWTSLAPKSHQRHTICEPRLSVPLNSQLLMQAHGLSPPTGKTHSWPTWTHQCLLWCTLPSDGGRSGRLREYGSRMATDFQCIACISSWAAWVGLKLGLLELGGRLVNPDSKWE